MPSRGGASEASVATLTGDVDGSTRYMYVCNSYTMHAKAASVLSARAQGRSPRARADKK